MDTLASMRLLAEVMEGGSFSAAARVLGIAPSSVARGIGALEVAYPDFQVTPGALDTSIYGVFPHTRHLSPKVRALVDLLVRRFGERPPWAADGAGDPA